MRVKRSRKRNDITSGPCLHAARSAASHFTTEWGRMEALSDKMVTAAKSPRRSNEGQSDGIQGICHHGIRQRKGAMASPHSPTGRQAYRRRWSVGAGFHNRARRHGKRGGANRERSDRYEKSICGARLIRGLFKRVTDAVNFAYSRLYPRRATIRPRIVRALAGAIRVEYGGSGVAHDVGIGLVQNIDIVAGCCKLIDQIAVEAWLQTQPRLLLAPGPPEHPARTIDRLGQRLAKRYVAREHRALRLRLAFAAHGAVGHDASVPENRQRRIERVERQPAGRERVQCATLQRKTYAAVLHQHAGARQHAARAELPIERLDVGHDETGR